MKKYYLFLLLAIPLVLAGCDYSQPDNRNGFFYDTFAKPMDQLLHWLGHTLGNDYGLAVIIIVIIVRTIMLPFMLGQVKNGHIMRKKMEVAKPEITQLQEKVKRARTQEEKMEANQEMMKKYQEYGMNPLKNMLGCLPVLLQAPVLFALYAVLKWPTDGGITQQPEFLWFNLLKPDIIITIIAGILYAIQAWISSQNMPQEQKSMGYMMMIISPVFIVFIAISSPSALALYWSVSAAYLIVQMAIANQIYSKVAEEEAGKLREKLNINKNEKRKSTKVVKNNRKK